MKRPVVLVFVCFPLLCLTRVTRASAQTPASAHIDTTSDAAATQACAALRQANFEAVPDAPAKITSARLADLTNAEFENQRGMSSAPARSSRIQQYCRVMSRNSISLKDQDPDGPAFR